MTTRRRLFCTAIVLILAANPVVPALGADEPPESVEINSLANLYETVTFDHVLHVEMADCSVCHHHTTGSKIIDTNCTRCHTAGGKQDTAIFNSGRPYTISCRECHEKDRFASAYLKELENPKLYHIDKPGLKGAYHLNCIGCHMETEGPTGCKECHTMTTAGEKMFNTGAFAPKQSGATSHHGHE